MDSGVIRSTGQRIGSLGFGTAPLGGLYTPVSEAAALDTVDRALAAGIVHADTAPFYGYGLAEERLGAGLARNPDQTVVISTKVGRVLDPPLPGWQPPAPWPIARPAEVRFDFTDKGLNQSLAASLERIGRAADIVFLHDPDRGTASPAELRDALAMSHRSLVAMRAAGLTQAIGIGTNSMAAAAMALEVGDWDILLVAGRYTLLEQEGLGDVLPTCIARGTGLIAAAPYNGGLLVGGDGWSWRPTTPEIAARATMLRHLAAEYGVPLAAAALQFPLAHAAVTSVLVGMRSVDEVEVNTAAASAPIPAAFWSALRERGAMPAAVPLPGGA